MRIIYGIIVPLFFGLTLQTATITAKSCSEADTQAAITAASPGDTVSLPAGTCAWAAQLAFAKSITLQGAGIGQTIIKDAMPVSDTGPKSALIRWTCVTNAAHRLTGIEFRDGGRTPMETNGIIRLECTNLGSTTFRVDHNKFDHLNGVVLRPDTAVGVMDHNTFLTGANRTPIYIFDSNWNLPVGADGYGDQSWHDPVTWGSSQFLFIEDNSFVVDPGIKYVCIDGYRGTRAVFRHNSGTRCTIELHGTESGQRSRGSRAVEIYQNAFDESGLINHMADLRSGSALMWGNTSINQSSNPAALKLDNYRTINNFANGFKGADGASPWDINQQSGIIPYTVIARAPLSVSAIDPMWPVNFLAGLTIRKTSLCDAINCFALILSNTAGTITYYSAAGSGFNPDLTFAVGATFTVNRVLITIDQIGRGGGSLITGTPPKVPVGWNDQQPFPVYEWANTAGGVPVHFAVEQSCVTCVEGRDFMSGPLPGYVPYVYPHPLTKGNTSNGGSH